MRKVEGSARTREEAIKNALDELGVEMYEVDNIEVIDEGSKGIFGLGARPVRVRVIVENLPELSEESETPAKKVERGTPRRGQGRQQREDGGSRKRNVSAI